MDMLRAKRTFVYVSIILTMLISWGMLRIADRLFARLGESGIRVHVGGLGRGYSDSVLFARRLSPLRSRDTLLLLSAPDRDNA